MNDILESTDSEELVSELEEQPDFDESEEEDSGTSGSSFVTLPDGTQVDLEELKNGYLRHADYTQKTQELAREREAIRTQESPSDPSGSEYADYRIPDVDVDILHEGERVVFEHALKRFELIERALVQLHEQVKPVVGDYQTTAATRAEIARVSERVGRVVTPDEIAKAKSATKEQDALAAMLLYERSGSPVRPKPKVPTGDRATVRQPRDKGFSALDAVLLAEAELRKK
jgi:hypothetical protein